MSGLVSLFVSFFVIGIVTFGGGTAMIPLLQQFVMENNWMGAAEFWDMVAISQMTPGPIAINMATYVGFSANGVIGAVVATMAVCLPAFLLIALIMTFLFNKSGQSNFMSAALDGLRPVVVGLIGVAVCRVGEVAFFKESTGSFDWVNLIVMVVVYISITKKKIHPIICILATGIFGALSLFIQNTLLA